MAEETQQSDDVDSAAPSFSIEYRYPEDIRLGCKVTYDGEEIHVQNRWVGEAIAWSATTAATGVVGAVAYDVIKTAVLASIPRFGSRRKWEVLAVTALNTHCKATLRTWNSPKVATSWRAGGCRHFVIPDAEQKLHAIVRVPDVRFRQLGDHEIAIEIYHLVTDDDECSDLKWPLDEHAVHHREMHIDQRVAYEEMLKRVIREIKEKEGRTSELS